MISLSKRAMDAITVVLALDRADDPAYPIYVACCDDPHGPIGSTASSLMQDVLKLSSASVGVEIADGSLSDPQEHKYVELIRQHLEWSKIFVDHFFFRVTWVTEGQYVHFFGVGVGSNSIKRERASRLALTVAVAVQRPDYKSWLASHAIIVQQIALPVAGATYGPWCLRPQPLRTIDTQMSQWPAARSRSPQRIPVHGRVSGVGGSRSPQGSQPIPTEPLPPWRKDLQEEVMNDVKQEPNDDVEEELIDRDTRGSDKDLQEEVMNDVKQEPNDDVEEELIDRDTIGSDKFYMRPPHPWRLTYDYDTHTQSYWHPRTQESSMNPPPGSLPVVRLPEKGTIGGAATRMRGIVISAVSSRSKSIKFSMGYGPRT
jgi:hypothetical protein